MSATGTFWHHYACAVCGEPGAACCAQCGGTEPEDRHGAGAFSALYRWVNYENDSLHWPWSTLRSRQRWDVEMLIRHLQRIGLIALILCVGCSFDAAGSIGDAGAAPHDSSVADATSAPDARGGPPVPDAEVVADATMPDARRADAAPIDGGEGEPCDLFGDDCAPELSCVWEGGALGVCEVAGAAIEGADCSESTDCAPGLACVQPMGASYLSCYVVCVPPTGCDGLCRAVPGLDPSVGVCP